MFTKSELLKNPDYLLTRYQHEIYRQLVAHMTAKKLSQLQVARELGVSAAYVNQILNGNFNFTLRKLIELGLLMGKVPVLEFVTPSEFWKHIDQVPQRKRSADKTSKRKARTSTTRKMKA
ncbi:MAG: helix-turn-helix domain-containing protein [Cyclobacteriaceae bacterium]|nr:helix-turn-helix domain-containing protein [Cyclobacteriaceae bacterium]